jgi:O-antigen ligase
LLQQFFAYGVVGLAMLAALYGSLWRRIVALPRGRSKGIFIGILLFVLVRGLAEAEPFDLLLPLWMITLLSCIADRSPETRMKSAFSIRVMAAGIPGSAAL